MRLPDADIIQLPGENRFTVRIPDGDSFCSECGTSLPLNASSSICDECLATRASQHYDGGYGGY